MDYPQYSQSLGYSEAGEFRHSGLGIASFIGAIIAGVGEFILVMIAGVIEVSTPGGMNEESPQAVILGLLMIAGLFLAMVGIGLGIAGLIQRECKKIFAILGLVFNLMIIFGVVGLFIIGLAMG